MKQNKLYYVTTPIYYANGTPHLGNTYSTTIADTLRRFYDFLEYETFFLTGTDEHGDKVDQTAQNQGKSPLEFTNEVSELFKKTWKYLGLNYSRFIRTTEESHKETVKKFLQKIYDQEDIYFGEYEGLYCIGCERFLTSKELIDGKCPDHQTLPQLVKESNYFFKMSKYQNKLLEHIKNNPDFIRPNRYKNEVISMLKEPLEDLCISRPKSRLTWGIELPFDQNYVTYVWFDALLNYLSGIDYPLGDNYKKFWPCAEHFIAKDILKPHAIFWPTMLLAAGLPLYQHLNVHGYWITPTGKMSKSLGNVVDPIQIKESFGMDVFRYYILREMVFGLDGTFSEESLITRYNADLANNLENLVSRTLAMVHKYRKGIIPTPSHNTSLEEELIKNANSCLPEVISFIQNIELHKAMERIWNLIDSANIYIDRVKPWELSNLESKGDQEASQRLDTSLYAQVETIRILGSLLTAFLPETSNKILEFLGFSKEEIKKQNSFNSAKWGSQISGQKLLHPTSLFPRAEKTPSQINEIKTPSNNENPTIDFSLISFEDFKKIELRVGQILEAEKIKKSKKLMKLSVDLKEQKGHRQIIAGIAEHYEAENLIGRKVAVVSNLQPAKLMGLLSEGMILAASNESGNLELISVPDNMPAGAIIK